MLCKNCGATVPDDANFCAECSKPIERETLADRLSAVRAENIPAGTLAAFVAAILSGALIVLLSQLGIFSAFGGLVLALAVFALYEKFAHHFSAAGIVICIIFVLATPYIADRVDWAIRLVQGGVETNVFRAFLDVHRYISWGVIARSDYARSLFFLYFFTICWGLLTIILSARQRRSK